MLYVLLNSTVFTDYFNNNGKIPNLIDFLTLQLLGFQYM